MLSRNIIRNTSRRLFPLGQRAVTRALRQRLQAAAGRHTSERFPKRKLHNNNFDSCRLFGH